MTLDYFLYKLIKAGEKMRELQKGYLKCDLTELVKLFLERNKAEREFDEIMESVKEFMKEELLKAPSHPP